MQPDPQVFLSGIRRELLKAAETGAADSAQTLTLLRAAEALAHLIVRGTLMPKLLSGVRPRQVSLLRQSADLIGRWGGEPPQAIEAIVLDSVSAAGEDAIHAYERLIDLQATCIRSMYAMASSPEQMRAADSLAAAICQLEAAVLLGREEGLQSIRHQQRHDEFAAEEKMLLTDEDVTAQLHAAFPNVPALRARNVKRHQGINTKEIYFLELEGRSDWPRDAVLRRNRAYGDNVGSEVADEFGPLEYLHGQGLPIPRPLLAGSGAPALKRSYLLTERLPGRVHSIATLGGAAKDVFADMAKRLGQLHNIDPRHGGAKVRIYGSNAAERMHGLLDRFYALWQSFPAEPTAILEVAFAWLRANVGRLNEAAAIVHGDWRLGNLLVTGNSISAILDWELAHEGHPAQDLGYCRLQVEQVMPWSEFLTIYKDHGGASVSDEEVRYFQIYGYTFGLSTVFPMIDGYARGRFEDFLLGSVSFIEGIQCTDYIGRSLLDEFRRSGVISDADGASGLKGSAFSNFL